MIPEGKQKDLQNAPPQVAGNVTNNLLNIGTDHLAFRVMPMCIKKEFAEIIDNYFTMFGYAVKKYKVPNVRGLQKREKWNYVKMKMD